VKGVAGNIGITEVQSAAQKLETAIREVEKSLPALLNDFRRLLDVQVRAIQKGLRDSAPAPGEAKSTMPFNGEAAASTIARLRSLLEACDGDAAEAFRDLQDAIAGAVEKPQLDALGASITDFDFETALRKLAEVAERCKLTEDQVK
jgi:HPt (histidine-containing phosphotransfer) domain-containing protein